MEQGYALISLTAIGPSFHPGMHNERHHDAEQNFVFNRPNPNSFLNQCIFLFQHALINGLCILPVPVAVWILCTAQSIRLSGSNDPGMLPVLQAARVWHIQCHSPFSNNKILFPHPRIDRMPICNKKKR